MNDAEWTAWMKKHSATFGLTTDADLGMLSAWREVFAVRGYGFQELTEATVWLAANDPPKFRSEHLPRLHGRINARRLSRMAAEREANAAPEKRCADCKGTALMIVPHLAFVVDGEWLYPWPTYAVCCNCPRGIALYESRRKASEQATQSGEVQKKPWLKWPQMSIGDYGMRNPRWKDQLRERDQARRAEMKATAAAKEADHKFAEILRGLVSDAKSREASDA